MRNQAVRALSIWYRIVASNVYAARRYTEAEQFANEIVGERESYLTPKLPLSQTLA